MTCVILASNPHSVSVDVARQHRTRATARRKQWPKDPDTGRMCVDRRVAARQRHSKKRAHYEELLARPQVAKS